MHAPIGILLPRYGQHQTPIWEKYKMTPQGIESLCTHAIASQGRFFKSYYVPLEKVHIIVRYCPEEDKGEKQCRVQYLPIEDASAAGQSELIQGSHALVYQQQGWRTREDERAHGPSIVPV